MFSWHSATDFPGGPLDPPRNRLNNEVAMGPAGQGARRMTMSVFAGG